MNPADTKHTRQGDPADLPIPIGYEVAGVLSAVGPDTAIASGGGAVGDEVLAFRVAGGWTGRITVPAADVFAKPAELGFPEAANLLLAGTTAADLIRAEALVRLEPAGPVETGLLALGQRRPQGFETRHGSELLVFLGQVVSRMMGRWLAV